MTFYFVPNGGFTTPITWLPTHLLVVFGGGGTETAHPSLPPDPHLPGAAGGGAAGVCRWLHRRILIKWRPQCCTTRLLKSSRYCNGKIARIDFGIFIKISPFSRVISNLCSGCDVISRQWPLAHPNQGDIQWITCKFIIFELFYFCLDLFCVISNILKAFHNV